MNEATTALQKAERFYTEGKYAEAMVLCVDLARTAPNTPGLDALRQKLLAAELARRADSIAKATPATDQAMALEAREKGLLPQSYGVVKTNAVITPPADRAAPTAMQKALKERITMHLKGADISAVIEAVARDRKINIIADRGVGAGRSVDVDMEDVPLEEVLDYVARNLGVESYVGANVIWLTAPSPKAQSPMVTRIYKLRNGVQFHASDWESEKTANKPPTTRKTDESAMQGLTSEATEISKKTTSIEEALKRFIPVMPGADYYFDRGTHALIIRHTLANLALAEDLIDALDAAPPQVLIEARFVTATVSDLRELGIDWMLDSSYGINSKGNANKIEVATTQVDKNGNVVYKPYTADGSGGFPLGPQGPFGEIRSGNPSTVAQGLNLTYRGLLTEPMFSAVLHALDIAGKGKVLSVPRVTTVNNTPAKLRNGLDLLYFDEFQSQIFHSYDAVTRTSQDYGVLIPKGKPIKEELGITLIAVPSVGADMDRISLMLMPTISEQKGWTDYQSWSNNPSANIQQVAVKLPIIERREVQTKVIVQSGETVVMGGLVTSVKQKTLHKVPFLSDLPLLGYLFTRLDETEHNENLLIFVTATVVSERGETLVPR
jgi:type IV pilus assembly protein PilQ